MAVTVTNAKSSLSLVLKVKSPSWDVEEFTNVDGRHHLGHPNTPQAGEGMGHLQISAPGASSSPWRSKHRCIKHVDPLDPNKNHISLVYLFVFVILYLSAVPPSRAHPTSNRHRYTFALCYPPFLNLSSSPLLLSHTHL